MTVSAAQKGLSRDTIKMIAMFTMLLNHIGHIFFTKGTVIYEVLEDIGYFTAITMCYFLVEGYRYTRSKKKYGERLLLFAILSELPYCLAFTKQGVLKFSGMNMIFTLLLCFLILVVDENIPDRRKSVFLIFLLIFGSSVSDWALLAPLFTIFFLRAEGNRKALRNAYLISAFLFGAFNYPEKLDIYHGAVGKSLFYAAASSLGILVSGFVILHAYHGQRWKKWCTFSKWFVYAFYPVHLLLLGIVRILVQK